MGRPMEFWYPWDYREWATHPGLTVCSHATRGILMDLQASVLNLWTGELKMPVSKLARLLRLSVQEVDDALYELKDAGVSIDFLFDTDPKDDPDTMVWVSFPKIKEFISKRESALEHDRARKAGGIPTETGRNSNGNGTEIVGFPDTDKKRVEEKRVEEKKPVRTRRTVEYSPAYLAFYEPYPNHQGKDDGFKAWNQIGAEDDMELQAAIREDVERRKREHWPWIKDGGAYIPLPASYLRGKRWTDEIKRAPAPAPTRNGRALPPVSDDVARMFDPPSKDEIRL